MKIRSIRGFHDILPESIKRWHFLEDSARKVFESYGFSEIRIPVLEFTEVFARSIGASTDIVEKEMYTFADRDESLITLRPEGTAGVVRSYIEHSMYARSPVTKLYYSGMMFRHERPQKGRYRGFYQIGAELLGPEEPNADAELIAMLMDFFSKVGLSEDLKLEISSLGDDDCRPAYREKLLEYFRPQEDKLCEDCRRRLVTNPLRVLDCKNPGCREIAADAPSMLDNLCGDCAAHFEEVRRNLESISIPFTVNPAIVRGLDYYTRTVFEVTTDRLGAQSAVAAGGRYDGLVKELGGPETSAVGFAMGIDRVVLLHETAHGGGYERNIDVYIAHLGEEALKKTFSIAHKLRSKGVRTEFEYGVKSLKSQLKKADKSGARYTFIIGEDELKAGRLTVRDMDKSSESEIQIQKVLDSPEAYGS